MIFCPALGHYVHPDDYTDGWTVEDEQRRLESQQEAADRDRENYWRNDDYWQSVDSLGGFWSAWEVELACRAMWLDLTGTYMDGEEIPF